jgi:hypothetical protein
MAVKGHAHFCNIDYQAFVWHEISLSIGFHMSGGQHHYALISNRRSLSSVTQLRCSSKPIFMQLTMRISTYTIYIYILHDTVETFNKTIGIFIIYGSNYLSSRQII